MRNSGCALPTATSVTAEAGRPLAPALAAIRAPTSARAAATSARACSRMPVMRSTPRALDPGGAEPAAMRRGVKR